MVINHYEYYHLNIENFLGGFASAHYLFPTYLKGNCFYFSFFGSPPLLIKHTNYFLLHCEQLQLKTFVCGCFELGPIYFLISGAGNAANKGAQRLWPTCRRQSIICCLQ